MAKVGNKYFLEDEFKIIEDGFDPAYGQIAESVFSLGNEYMGIRGCFEEGYSGKGLRGSYFNGIYEIYRQKESSYVGISNLTEYMVNSVDYFACRLELDGERLDMHHSKFERFRRELDMRTGILYRFFIWITDSGKATEITFERFLSMEQTRMGAQKIILKPLNYNGEIKVSMFLDFSVIHESAGENRWQCSEHVASGDFLSITGTTLSTGQKVISRARLFGPLTNAVAWTDEKQVGSTCRIYLKNGKSTVIGRTVDNLVCKIINQEQNSDLPVSSVSYESLQAANSRWWDRIWAASDIRIEGDISNQQGIRFCIFQMFQTCHGTIPGANIGAKGLTGEAYNGNAFWDTETYCLPFYLFNDKEAAKNLLLFRYMTLEEAKGRAGELDCNGAFYPIATISGRECCNLWQHANIQLQASTAVAYGIWFYEKQMKDTDFILKYGAEMLTEISRMLADRGDFSSDGKKYGYYGVMGPDEFQMMVNHNFYTNYMGKFTLEYTLEVLDRMEQKFPEAFTTLEKKIGLTREERQNFKRAAESMYLPYDHANGLFEQHEGYFQLPHVDVDRIPTEEFPLYHHWTYDRIYRNDMIKQPDVLMLMFLFRSRFTQEQLLANYEYYEPRCIHESSLSPSVHSVLAAQLGKHEAAYDFFAFATRMDLDNYNRNTHEGLHTTSIAAGWINIVYGFGGMRTDGGTLSFFPSIPAKWESYSFQVAYEEDILLVQVGKEQVCFRTKEGKELDIIVYGHSLRAGGEERKVTIPSIYRG